MWKVWHDFLLIFQKPLLSPSDDNKEELLALLKTQDTFCYLDQLTPSPSYPTHGFYPVGIYSFIILFSAHPVFNF